MNRVIGVSILLLTFASMVPAQSLGSAGTIEGMVTLSEILVANRPDATPCACPLIPENSPLTGNPARWSDCLWRNFVYPAQSGE
jgi:hypothetical protein